MIPFTGIILAVFVLAKVLEQIFSALFLSDADQHLSVSLMTIFQITLISIKANVLLDVA